MSLDKITKNIVDAVKGINKQGTSAYDTTAEVRRIEGNTAWVHIAGGVDETPVNLTIAAKAGDTVQVRVGGGRAWITGNETAPPTDDGMAMIANNTAVGAGKTAKQALEEANNAMEEANALAASMAETVIRINSDIAGLQDQVDGNITTWFYAYVPTTSNMPASEWISEGTEDVHLGDLFYNTTTGYAYRWMFDGANYSWLRITDTDVTKALADAAAAQDTADSKRRVFYNTPTAPYDLGDLWVQGSSGDILRCSQAKAEGASYSVSDWVLASKYTDDTVANQAISDAAAAASAASAAQASATAASTAASSAQTSANNAQASAETANDSANSALSQLGVVEQVVDTLSWISEHGEYDLTADETPVDGKYYFTYDGTSYAVVTSIEESDNPHILGYYELVDVDSAVSNYISTHLALTNDGLYLQTSQAAGYKVLISPTEGMVMYGSLGQVIAKYGDTALIGEKTGFHIEADGTELGFYEGETKVAYINNNTLHIAQSVVLNEMQIGERKWAWKIDPNDDSIYLKWIG